MFFIGALSYLILVSIQRALVLLFLQRKYRGTRGHHIAHACKSCWCSLCFLLSKTKTQIDNVDVFSVFSHRKQRYRYPLQMHMHPSTLKDTVTLFFGNDDTSVALSHTHLPMLTFSQFFLIKKDRHRYTPTSTKVDMVLSHLNKYIWHTHTSANVDFGVCDIIHIVWSCHHHAYPWPLAKQWCHNLFRDLTINCMSGIWSVQFFLFTI